MKKFFKTKFLNASKVAILKKAVIEIFNQNSLNKQDLKREEKKSLSTAELKKITEFNEIFFSERFKIILENFFGNLENLYFMSFDIQKNKRLFTTSKTYGFHQDSGKLHQNIIINREKNVYFKIGVYLQDNSKYFGGGIDLVKPFFLEKYLNKKIRYYLSVLVALFKIRVFDNHLNTHMGEMIGICGTVFHRTSPTKKKIEKPLSDRYSIYFNICNKDILDDLGFSKKEIENNMETLKFGNFSINSLNKDFSSKIREFISD